MYIPLHSSQACTCFFTKVVQHDLIWLNKKCSFSHFREICMFSVSLKVAYKNIQTRQKPQKEKWLFKKVIFCLNILWIRTFPFSDDFRKNFTTKTKTFGRNKLSVLENIAITQLIFNPGKTELTVCRYLIDDLYHRRLCKIKLKNWNAQHCHLTHF